MKDSLLKKKWLQMDPSIPDEPPGQSNAPPKEEDEDSCTAFGFLRGIRDRAMALEFRFSNGKSKTFSYHLLHEMTYIAPAGLLLKLVGDKITLVLIEGTNLNAQISGGASLYDRGLQRHRVTWIKEMTRQQADKAGENDVIVARIRMHSYRSDEEPQDVAWLKPFQEPA